MPDRVGYETDDGLPVDFAWPDAKIAVFLDLEADDPRVAGAVRLARVRR